MRPKTIFLLTFLLREEEGVGCMGGSGKVNIENGNYNLQSGICELIEQWWV